MSKCRNCRGLSLLEVLVTSLIFLVAVLTMVGYTGTIHRVAAESKHQALASMEARSLLERIKDHPPLFEQASDPAGYTETQTEYLLDGEARAEDNEVGRQAAVEFELKGRTIQVSDDVYKLVVTAAWEADGRVRQVILESRMIRPGF